MTLMRQPDRRPPGAIPVRSADDDVMLRPQQIMEQYGIGRTRLYTWLASGEIPSVKLGRTRHVWRSDLEAFLAERSL